jgi:signal transduction histidine kinase
VRLVRLPGNGEPLIRASIIDSRERQRREKIQRATFQISEAVHTAADLPNLYREIHTIVAGLMPARNFYIALLEPLSQMIEFAYHVDERASQPPPQPMNTGLTSVVLRLGKPLLVGHEMAKLKQRVGQKVAFEGLEQAAYLESGLPAAVWLGVPLLLQGKAIGVVAVQDYENPHAYCDNDKQILTFVAGQIALAIERKRAEAELLRTLAREKELGQLKSTFVSMVSHEFRTPLAIIQSSAEILRDYFPQLEAFQREEQLQSIIKNTQRMAGIMEEILVLSRLDSGKMEFKPAPLDLTRFCHTVVDQVLSATGRQCPIELCLRAPVPEAHADERLLGYILSNLLGNAVKYSPPGQPVHFSFEREDSHVLCRICDQGIGIPAADQPWLFNAFHRGRNVGERPGTGLGLVLVKRCVELHRGQIRIESTLGKGTQVTLRLPVFQPL